MHPFFFNFQFVFYRLERLYNDAKAKCTKENASFEQLTKYTGNVSQVRYYFNVSNSYVLNKIRLLLFPFRHASWSRLSQHNEVGQEMYRPPREDLNAPDLYIPGTVSLKAFFCVDCYGIYIHSLSLNYKSF